MEVPNFISLIKIAKHNATGVFFIIDWYAIYDVFYSKPIFDKKNTYNKYTIYCLEGRVESITRQTKGKLPKEARWEGWISAMSPFVILKSLMKLY